MRTASSREIIKFENDTFRKTMIFYPDTDIDAISLHLILSFDRCGSDKRDRIRTTRSMKELESQSDDFFFPVKIFVYDDRKSRYITSQSLISNSMYEDFERARLRSVDVSDSCSRGWQCVIPHVDRRKDFPSKCFAISYLRFPKVIVLA